MANFTPGPWTWEVYHHRLYAEGDYTVLEATLEGTMYFGDYPEKTEGNRNLIGAAPEMYEALKAAEKFIEEELQVRRNSFLPGGSPYIDEAESALKTITVAITKADGGAQ